MTTQTETPEGEGSKTSLIVFSLIALVVAGLAFNSWRVRTGWLHALKGSDPAARRAAAQAMMRRGQVAEQLQGQPPSVRVAAVRALAEVRTPDAATEIIQFRKDPDDPVKDLAAKKLIEMGPDIVMKPALDALENSDDAIGSGVQDVLKDGQFTKTDIPVVAQKLYHPDARNNAAGILTDLKTVAIPSVLPFLHPKPEALIGTSTVEDVQLTAIGILDSMHDPKAIEAIPNLIEMLQYQHTQRNAVGALGRMPPENAKVAVPALLKVLHDNELIRSETVVALGNLGDARAIPALVQLLGSFSEDLRRQTSEALRNMGAPAVPALQAAARSPSATVRAAAIRAIAGIPTPAAKETTLAALKDPDPDVRVEAAGGLADRKDASTVPALLTALNDRDGRVGTEAARALAVIGRPAVPPLVAALKAGPGQPQAYYAQQALRDIHAIALPELTRAARGGDPVTARFAALLLGDMGGGPRSVEALKAAAQRPEPEVQWAARRSLDALLVTTPISSAS
jgi:HEAT repeat protein